MAFLSHGRARHLRTVKIMETSSFPFFGQIVPSCPVPTALTAQGNCLFVLSSQRLFLSFPRCLVSACHRVHLGTETPWLRHHVLDLVHLLGGTHLFSELKNHSVLFQNRFWLSVPLCSTITCSHKERSLFPIFKVRVTSCPGVPRTGDAQDIGLSVLGRWKPLAGRDKLVTL